MVAQATTRVSTEYALYTLFFVVLRVDGEDLPDQSSLPVGRPTSLCSRIVMLSRGWQTCMVERREDGWRRRKRRDLFSQRYII